MSGRFAARVPALIVFCFFTFESCAKEQPPAFSVTGNDAPVLAANSFSAAGVLDFSKPARLDYRFVNHPPPAFPSSLEIEYAFSAPLSEEIKNNYQIVFESESGSWLLPFDFSFLGALGGGAEEISALHYAVPVKHLPAAFSVSLALSETSAEKNRRRGGQLPRFAIHSLALTKRWYGFYAEEAAGGRHFFASPFVFARNAESSAEYVIDPPPENNPPALFAAAARDGNSGIAAAVENHTLKTAASALYLAPGFISRNAGPVALTGGDINSFQINYSAPPPFPSPLTADPGVILDWPAENWRDSRFEVFRWEQFSSLLIFDTADYAMQDRLFKRLAFFVEKAGFRGRLAGDAEIAALHGWNAHDYRAEDLARFFETARAENFPLLREERDLEQILFDAGIIRAAADGSITAGTGGIISVSRESAAYLRSLFMAHEGFHGLFFIDENFRDFSRQRWNALPRAAKNFILGYFDYQHYDIGDEYLMVNEFMAHILQQPSFRAAVYFGETLPRRLETSPRRAPILGGKNEETDSWPDFAAAFTREAEAFSAYVNERWELAAGRVWQVF